jgi:hypothetical protein
VSAPHLATGFGGDAFDLVLSGTRRLAYRPYSDRWDEPWVEGPALVQQMPELVEARLEQGELMVWGPLGVLAADYDALALAVNGRPVSLDALRAAVAAYWDAWRKENDLRRVHRLVLEHRADRVSIEADCNGGEMVSRLRDLALAVRQRHPRDRRLPDTARTALSHRPLG